MQLQYSTLKYKPSPISDESITLGILFHEASIDHREFVFEEDLACLAEFDPELDIDLVRKLLCGIKEEVESMQTFDIEDFTRFYINAFLFEDRKHVKYDVLADAIEHIAATCFT